MKNTLLSILFWANMATSAVAQRPINIDSLRRVMARLERNPVSFANDTARINTLLEISTYHYIHSDSALFFGQKALALAQKADWPQGVIESYLSISEALTAKNQFIAATDTTQKAIAMARKIQDNRLLAGCYWIIAGIHGYKRNLPLAIKYFELQYQAAFKVHDYYSASMAMNNAGTILKDLGNRSKAFRYFQRSLTIARQHHQPLVEAMSLSNLGNILKDSVGHEAEGIRYVEQGNKLFKQLNRPIFLADGLETIGAVYLKKKQYAKALPYIQQAWNTYHTYNWPQGLDDGHNFDKSLYRIHKGLKQPEKALFYLEQYTTRLDTALQAEIKSGRDVVQMQLDKEKQQGQISQLKIKELEQQKVVEARTRQGLFGGIGLLLLLVGGVAWYNRRLQNQNTTLAEKNELIRAATHKIQTTEMAALRSQMNPHFIFNCLNSIQFFTAQNDAERASDYLTKFSRLIRLVLENSKSEKVTLANELETLRLYIEMEAMRFQQKVQYNIQIDKQIDAESVEIPPLLLQPFVENAIWHGLMHKEDGGTVTVSVQQPRPDCLQVQITDDGVGRQKAAEYKSKSATKNKSLGMKMTAERIELINQLYQTQTHITIADLTDADGQPTGTQVVVDIPI